MKETERLQKNKDFQVVYQEGRSKANRQYVMYVRENGFAYNRIGVSVSKKVGNSVVRHRIKRLVKESYRLSEDIFLKGYDIVVIARGAAKEEDFHQTRSALLHLGRKQGLII